MAGDEPSFLNKKYLRGKTIIIVTSVLAIVFLTICAYQLLKRRGQLLSGKRRAEHGEEDKTVVIEQQSISISNDPSLRPSDISIGGGDSSINRDHDSSKTHMRHCRGISMDSNFSNTSASPMFNASMALSNVQ